jgi:hypothetical protein
MDLNAVMDEIGERLGGIDELNVFDYPAPTVMPPAAILSYPDGIDYDETYRRGMDRIRDLPLIVIDGKANEREARKRIAAYVAGTGDRSVKAVLESGTYTSFDVIRVTAADFDVIKIGSVDYIAALFTLDIAGQGA